MAKKLSKQALINLSKSGIIESRERETRAGEKEIYRLIGESKGNRVIDALHSSQGAYITNTNIPTLKLGADIKRAIKTIKKDPEGDIVGIIAYDLYKNTRSGKWIDNWNMTKAQRGLRMLEQLEFRGETDWNIIKGDTKDLPPEAREKLMDYNLDIEFRMKQGASLQEAKTMIQREHTKEEKAALDKIFKELK